MRSLYSEHPTWLHRVGAGTKLLGLALAGTALFTVSQPAVLAGAAAVVLAMLASLGRAARPATRTLVSIVVASALIVGFHWLAASPMIGIISALRLLSASVLGVMLTLTTRFDALLDAFEMALSPLAMLGLKTDKIALALGLMLRFTEHFFVQWRRLDDAHRARTGRAGGFRLLAPLTIRMLIVSRAVGDALTARSGR